jgi:hypothetical protein
MSHDWSKTKTTEPTKGNSLAPAYKEEPTQPKEPTRETFTPESFDPAKFPNMTFAPADGAAFTMPTSNPVTRSKDGKRQRISRRPGKG